MTEKPEKIYGRTKSGLDITDELIDNYVAEAEAGFDLSKLRAVGRPRLGTAPAKAFPVRLDPELRTALDECAAAEDRPASEVVREALRRYLEQADLRPAPTHRLVQTVAEGEGAI